MEKRIIHLDMDAFFASVEQLDNPQYRGLPLVVGGSPTGRGVVAAASYEARVFGIRSAMSSREAQQRCASLIFVKPRFERYREISQRVFSFFTEYTADVEPVALDEAFLDVTGAVTPHLSATRIAEQLRRRIFTELGLTASAGVSFNKFLAKCASECCKPDGLFVIRPSHAAAFIDNLPIGRFPGVGPATAEKFFQIGVRCGRTLREISQERLLSLFGKRGHFFFNLARGIDGRIVKASRERKSLGVERTFDKDLGSRREMSVVLEELAEELHARMSRREVHGTTIVLKARSPDFLTASFSYTLPNPHLFETCAQITSAAQKLLLSYLSKHSSARLLGLTLKGIVLRDDARRSQLALSFDPQ